MISSVRLNVLFLAQPAVVLSQWSFADAKTYQQVIENEAGQSVPQQRDEQRFVTTNLVNCFFAFYDLVFQHKGRTIRKPSYGYHNCFAIISSNSNFA